MINGGPLWGSILSLWAHYVHEINAAAYQRNTPTAEMWINAKLSHTWRKQAGVSAPTIWSRQAVWPAALKSAAERESNFVSAASPAEQTIQRMGLSLFRSPFFSFSRSLYTQNPAVVSNTCSKPELPQSQEKFKKNQTGTHTHTQ